MTHRRISIRCTQNDEPLSNKLSVEKLDGDDEKRLTIRSERTKRRKIYERDD